jgi:DNA-binding response OmpR family regulator
MENILIIDDDKDLCKLLTEYLKPEGFQVESAHNVETGIERVQSGAYSLVLLDVMLPGKGNGFSVLQRIRSGTRTPTLMLTARGDEVDRILGLEMGADDYLPKPFNPRELLARIHAILRRSRYEKTELNAGNAAEKYKVGDVLLDSGTRTVFQSNEAVELTSVEFNLLEIFLRHAGRIITRSELTKKVLGRDLSPYDRSIDVHVSKLRKKLGRESGGIERIKAIRGSGYIYVLAPISEKRAAEQGSRSSGKGEESSDAEV